MTNRTEKYTLYFQALVDELREQHNFTRARCVQGRHFHAFPSGKTDIKYVAGFYSEGRQAFTVLGLYSGNGERNKAIFDFLKERKSEIEARFGEALEWYRRNDINRSAIGLWRDGDVDSDERTLEDIKAWHIENLLKLKYVFTPEIHKSVLRI